MLSNFVAQRLQRFVFFGGNRGGLSFGSQFRFASFCLFLRAASSCVTHFAFPLFSVHVVTQLPHLVLARLPPLAADAPPWLYWGAVLATLWRGCCDFCLCASFLTTAIRTVAILTRSIHRLANRREERCRSIPHVCMFWCTLVHEFVAWYGAYFHLSFDSDTLANDLN